MQDTGIQNKLPRKYKFAHVMFSKTHIKPSELERVIEELITALNIQIFDFKYRRKDKKSIFGTYTSFYFWLESESKKLILLECNPRKTLSKFLEVLMESCDKKNIKVNNEFEKDGYLIDNSKKEIVRKIYRKTNYNTM